MSSEDKQSLSDNSDEDELPELGGVNLDQKFEINQHDIVWAEFRNIYWPALVRCVKKKERKASVWYLDSPRKCFKVPFNRIKSFSDPKMTALIKAEVENSPVKAKHKRIWLSAITYIRRKTQGYNDDPAIYFDLDKHYLVYKNQKLDNHCSSKDEKNDPKIENSNFNTNTKNSDEVSTDEESLLSDDDEENVIDKKLSIFINLNETCEDEPEADNIVKCIASGHVDKHLLQIKAKKVPSHYQNLYEDAMTTNKSKLMNITPSNHVKSTQKLKEIAIYLMNYYEKVVEGGKCEMNNYVFYVWLPEAIEKAVELINEGSLDLNKTISESRRRLFPTDKLVNPEIYDPLAPLLESCVDTSKVKKRRGPTRISKNKQKALPNEDSYQNPSREKSKSRKQLDKKETKSSNKSCRDEQSIDLFDTRASIQESSVNTAKVKKRGQPPKVSNNKRRSKRS